MSHEHSHQHSHTINAESLNKAFIIGIVLNLAFVVIEFAAGFWFDSLALLSDAGHNLSDVVSLVLALLLSAWPKSKPMNAIRMAIKKYDPGIPAQCSHFAGSRRRHCHRKYS